MIHRTLGAGLVLLLGGCAATPPPPPGPTMEQFQALSATAESLAREKADLQALVAALGKSLEEVRRTGDETARERGRLETEVKRLEIELKDWIAMELAHLEDRVAALEGRPPAGTDARPESPMHTGPVGAPGTMIKGVVLAADGQMGVYLISVGKKDGLKIADELTVFRGDRFVAQVVVDKVFEDKASVVVKKIHDKPMLKLEIKTGDKVSTVL